MAAFAYTASCLLSSGSKMLRSLKKALCKPKDSKATKMSQAKITRAAISKPPIAGSKKDSAPAMPLKSGNSSGKAKQPSKAGGKKAKVDMQTRTTRARAK